MLLLASFVHADEKVTYDDHVLPIFQQTCLNCHNPDKTKGGLDLSSFSAAMRGGSGGKIAEPGDTGSKLIAVVMQTSEPKMPPEGDKLGGDQIDMLKRWVEGGLLETKSSKARKPSKPKFDTALAAAPDAKPEGPLPMPTDMLLDPPVLAARSSSVNAMVSSPWSPLLAVTGQRQVLLFDTNSLELAGVLPFPEGDPVSLAFTPNARYLIVGGGVPGKSGITVTFDVVTGERMLVAGKEFDSVLATDLKPDLSTVVTGSPSRLIKVWKSEDGSQLKSIKKHTDWVTALDFSPDGILLATGDRNGGVWVWEADSGNEFHTLRAHQAGITAAAFRADSNLLATASEDGTVRFWEMNGGSEVKKVDAHGGGVLAFSWARDGSFITSGRDKVVKLWKPDFNLLREFKDLPDLPVAVAFDPDKKRAFSADYRGQITAWDIESGDQIGVLDNNPPSIEQRLISLREKIHKHPEAVAAAETKLSAAYRELEQVRKTLTDAESALNQARELHIAAIKGKEEIEQRLQQAVSQLPQKREQAAQARGRLDEAQREIDAKRSEISAADQRIASTEEEHQAATTELKRREDELAKARSENRHDALANLEAAINEQRSRTEASAQTLQDARSQRERELGLLSEIESRHRVATEEIAKLDGEAETLKQATETLPNSIKGAEQTVKTAQAKITERETAIQPAREAVGPVEKKAEEAKTQLETTKQLLASLQTNERHWAAAQINAQAIRTGAEARQLEIVGEDLVAEFEEIARELDETRGSLESARGHLAELESTYSTLPADSKESKTSAELIEKAKTQIAELENAFGKASSAFTKAKAAVDKTLPNAHALRAKAENLKARYLVISSGK